MGIQLNQHRRSITQSVTASFSDDKTPTEGLSVFFKTTTTADKQLSIEVERFFQKIAVDVIRCSGANRNVFDRSTEKIFVPPYYNEFFDFTSCQRYDETFATVMSGSNPNVYDVRALIKSAAGYALALKNKIARAKELQRAQVLQTGVVQLKNGDSIDYRRQAASMMQKTGTGQWSDLENSDPKADLDVQADFIKKQGLSTGGVYDVVMGQSAASNFLSNKKVRSDAQFFGQFKRTDIGMPQMNEVTGFTYLGRVAGVDKTYDLWTYSGFYTNEANQQVDYLDTDTVVVIARDFVGLMAHAGVPAIMNVPNIGSIVAPKEGEYYVRDVIDQVNLTWQYYVSSAPLAIPVSVDRFATIKTKL